MPPAASRDWRIANQAATRRNRIGEAVHRQVIALALDEPELSPREVAVACFGEPLIVGLDLPNKSKESVS
jgi:hypothetical protein